MLVRSFVLCRSCQWFSFLCSLLDDCLLLPLLLTKPDSVSWPCYFQIEHQSSHDLNLSQMFDPDGLNEEGYHRIHVAARKGDINAVQKQLDKGVSPDVETRSGGYTALHYAVEKEHLDIIKLLAEHKATLDKP